CWHPPCRPEGRIRNRSQVLSAAPSISLDPMPTSGTPPEGEGVPSSPALGRQRCAQAGRTPGQYRVIARAPGPFGPWRAWKHDPLGLPHTLNPRLLGQGSGAVRPSFTVDGPFVSVLS